MPTTTTGVFFVARQRLQAAADQRDGFKLTLRVVDNQGPGRVEPYLITWKGEEARTWWQANEQRIQPGTPLRLELHNPRSFPGLRAPETHATVHACTLAPLAPSWQGHAHPAEQQPPRAMPV